MATRSGHGEGVARKTTYVRVIAKLHCRTIAPELLVGRRVRLYDADALSDDFLPTLFGRQVQGMGPVEPDQINGLGFMLSDKKPGRFGLKIGSVHVLRAGE